MLLSNRRRGVASRLLVGAAAATVLVALTGSAALAAGWKSGARNNDSASAFASWRGTPLGVVSG